LEHCINSLTFIVDCFNWTDLGIFLRRAVPIAISTDAMLEVVLHASIVHRGAASTCAAIATVTSFRCIQETVPANTRCDRKKSLKKDKRTRHCHRDDPVARRRVFAAT
jgi:hypothetical protein